MGKRKDLGDVSGYLLGTVWQKCEVFGDLCLVFFGMEEPPAVPLESGICTLLISMCLSLISMEHKLSELGFEWVMPPLYPTHNCCDLSECSSYFSFIGYI